MDWVLKQPSRGIVVKEHLLPCPQKMMISRTSRTTCPDQRPIMPSERSISTMVSEGLHYLAEPGNSKLVQRIPPDLFPLLQDGSKVSSGGRPRKRTKDLKSSAVLERLRQGCSHQFPRRIINQQNPITTKSGTLKRPKLIETVPGFHHLCLEELARGKASMMTSQYPPRMTQPLSARSPLGRLHCHSSTPGGLLNFPAGSVPKLLGNLARSYQGVTPPQSPMSRTFQHRRFLERVLEDNREQARRI